MADGYIALLADRGAVSVTGTDAVKLLQGLITNEMGQLDQAPALFAGLLSPQGKILFDFLVVKTGDGFILDVARDRAGDLAKRLTLYKLRADVAIADVSPSYRIFALWGGGDTPADDAVAGMLSVRDPRHEALGFRLIADAQSGFDPATLGAREATAADYHAHRIAIGVPEGGKDYDFGDAYPHEADFDVFHGVSFTKGCFVGQEVVARMQNKTIVRKRVVKVKGASALQPGAEIKLGDVTIGKIGSAAGAEALALLRLDRAAEAEDKGLGLTASSFAITADADALARYRAAAASRAASPRL